MILLLLLFYGTPIVISCAICEAKNRNMFKGAFLTLFFGWFATIGLWLALRRRSEETGQLL